MTVFDQMINDVFSVEDFIEILTVDNVDVRVSSYVARNAAEYTEFGYNPGNTVEVACKCSDWTPARGQIVTFRGAQWKVSEFSVDSHALTYRVLLRNLESK